MPQKPLDMNIWEFNIYQQGMAYINHEIYRHLSSLILQVLFTDFIGLHKAFEEHGAPSHIMKLEFYDSIGTGLQNTFH